MSDSDSEDSQRTLLWDSYSGTFEDMDMLFNEAPDGQQAVSLTQSNSADRAGLGTTQAATDVKSAGISALADNEVVKSATQVLRRSQRLVAEELPKALSCPRR